MYTLAMYFDRVVLLRAHGQQHVCFPELRERLWRPLCCGGDMAQHLHREAEPT